MTLTAKVGSYSRSDERAAAPGHGPVLLTGQLKADDGEYPVGLLLTRKSDGKLEPLQSVSGEVLGTGDAGTAAFSGTLAAGLPMEPGTLSVTDGVETFADDGHGVLTGDAGGSGTINYKTGAVSVTFDANVGDGDDVTMDYLTRIDGVLDELVDTAERAAGVYVHHGTCKASALKIGASAEASPSDAVLGLLRDNGIYPT